MAGITGLVIPLATLFLVSFCAAYDSDDLAELEKELVNLELNEAKRELLEYEAEEPMDSKRALDPSCKDQVGRSRCLNYEKLGLCQKDYRLKKLCSKTCGFCGRMPTVPHCAKMKLGCCWDERTPKRNPQGTNCPVCQDRSDQKRICRKFKPDCNSSKDAGKHMRVTCPKTCGVCGKEGICRDNPEQEFFCPDWRKQGLCETNKPMMSVYCRGTCGFC